MDDFILLQKEVKQYEGVLLVETVLNTGRNSFPELFFKKNVT